MTGSGPTEAVRPSWIAPAAAVPAMVAVDRILFGLGLPKDT